MEKNQCYHPEAEKRFDLGGYEVYFCPSCLLFFRKRNDGPDTESDYQSFYTTEIRQNDIVSVGRFGFGVEKIIKLFRLYRALLFYTLAPRAKNILDIGCGRGFTLYYLRKYFGFKRTAGIQIAENACRFAREKLQLEVYQCDLLTLGLPAEEFDIVTMWHVLEHLPDPETYWIEISRILKKGGLFLFETPNFNSWTRRWTGQYWLGLDMENHVNFFTRETLKKMALKYDFKICWISFFSFEYSIFISVQSIVSWLTATDHLVFNYLQHRIPYRPVLILHALLFVLLAPACLIINGLLYFSPKGEVLRFATKREA